MAAISAVFTIGYVANLLGEDEGWLFEPSIGMEPEDGSFWVYGVGDDGVPAFTRDGIDNLREEQPETRCQLSRRNKASCGAHRMVTPVPAQRRQKGSESTST